MRKLFLLLLFPVFLRAQIQNQSSFEAPFPTNYPTAGVCKVAYTPFYCLQGSTSYAITQSNIARSGNYSFRAEVRPGDPATNVGSYRAEMVVTDKSMVQQIAPNTYAYSAYVPSSNSAAVNASDDKILGPQWHAWRKTPAYDGGSPNLASEVAKGKWQWKVRYTAGTSTSSPETIVRFQDSAVVYDTWNDFIVYADFDKAMGHIKVWRTTNSRQTVVFEYHGPCMHLWADDPPYMKIGGYRWLNPSSGGASAALVGIFDIVRYGKSTIDRAPIDFAPDGSTPVPNQPPICFAGNNQSLAGGTTSTTLSGATASDPEGGNLVYLWERVSGPNTPTFTASTLNPTISGLVTGAYVFRLTVTDNKGATATSTVGVSVATVNTPPVAQALLVGTSPKPAGTTQFQLDGEATDAQDPSITNHVWTQVSGPNTATLVGTQWNPVVTGVIGGTYVFKLRVQDSGGLSSEATVSVVVLASNVPPVVTPSPPYILLNSATSTPIAATAVDPESKPMTYLWSQSSGPNTSVITNGTTLTATASGLIVGQYIFQIAVTDSMGGVSYANVTVEVNKPPVVDISGNTDTLFITGTISVPIVGTATDEDGTIASYQWTVVNGSGTFVNANTNNTTFTASGPGDYILRLTATDNDGGIGYQDYLFTIKSGYLRVSNRKALPAH